ncbi:MAG: SH3 domain-containing protein [Arachnia propionica]|uniref:SH3 domain-containing protein n=1 Tax=Arachnia propionica TaxID=1750 RepID=UPI00270B0CA8|nr:SH3 domain-containing protein [Arachnia propionica]
MNRIVQTRRVVLAAGMAAGILQTVGSLAFVAGADAANVTMQATTSVNVRKGPGTRHTRLGMLRKGDRIVATGTEGSWTKVEYKGAPAFVFSRYLTPVGGDEATAPVPGSAGTAFTTVNLNLRTAPNLSSRVRTIARKGTKLSLTGSRSGDFTQVTWHGENLWAATRYLSEQAASAPADLPTPTRRMRATTALMIRTTPDRSYKSLGDVPRGTILDCTHVVTNGMVQAIHQGNVRWFNGKFLVEVNATAAPAPSPQPATTTKYATAELNIWHSSTGKDYSGTISKGSELQVTGVVENARAQIMHKGAARWVTARYVSATPPNSSGSGDSGGTLNKGWSSGLDQTNANIKKIVRHVWANIPEIKTMYGWRRDVTPDHPAGRAVDIMIPNYRSNHALGQRIAEFFKANHKEFRVHYIIWNQQIWNISRDKEGWRNMASRGSDTANHKDHVHITCYDN